MAVENRFHIADIVVFGITIIVSIGIGIYYAFSGGKQKTTSEFLLGGRLISYIPVAISLMVSFESSIMMLGMPAESYVYGLQLVIGSLGFFISQMLSINLVVPLLHPLKITSAYEYLEYRFNSKPVRLLGTVLGMLNYCWYMGIVLFGPAVALEAVTGFPRWASIITISTVAVIYTSIGGLKAVVWTDVFQAFVMFAGIFAILIKGTMEVGGSQEVWNTAVEGGRVNLFVFDLDPRTRHTFFNLLFSKIIRGFGMSFNQSTIQRISSTKSVREAKKVLTIVAPAFLFSFVLALMEGIVAYAYYVKKGCDPFESEKLNNPNQIIPFFVMDVFSNLPGMPGLFLASLFSASLSTLSSGLSSLSALLWADIVHPLVGDISEVKATLIAKLSVLGFGILACGLAFLVSMIGGTLIQISASILSAFAGPVTGIFLLGCFCHRSNAKGAFWGGMIGLTLTCWFSFGKSFSNVSKPTPWLDPAPTDQCYAGGSIFNDTMTTTMAPNTSLPLEMTLMSPAILSDDPEPSGVELIYTLSYTWIAPFSILSVIFFGYIISLITGPNKPGDVDPRYLLEFSAVLLIFMPARVKKWASSLGPQFIKEEYKSKFPDPALRERMQKTEMTILPPEDGGESGDAGEPLLLSMTSHDEKEVTRVTGGCGDAWSDSKGNKNDNSNYVNTNGAPAAVIVTDEKNEGNSRNSNGIVLHGNGNDDEVEDKKDDDDGDKNNDDDDDDEKINAGGNDGEKDNDDGGDDDVKKDDEKIDTCDNDGEKENGDDGVEKDDEEIGADDNDCKKDNDAGDDDNGKKHDEEIGTCENDGEKENYAGDDGVEKDDEKIGAGVNDDKQDNDDGDDDTGKKHDETIDVGEGNDKGIVDDDGGDDIGDGNIDQECGTVDGVITDNPPSSPTPQPESSNNELDEVNEDNDSDKSNNKDDDGSSAPNQQP